MLMPRSSTCQLILLAVAALTLPDSTEAQHGGTPAADKTRASVPIAADELLLLTYEVGDLILDVPDYPYVGALDTPRRGFGGGGMEAARGGMGGMGGVGGGMGGMGGGMDMGGGGVGGGVQGFSSGSAGITMEDLVRVLVKVIAPTTWTNIGGEGEIEALGMSLVIRQTNQVHQEIQDLLDQLRKGSGKRKTVAIDARWLLLDSDELERLMPPNQGGQPQIDRAVLGEFTRRPSSIRGLTNCFTGQLVYLVSGTRRNVVTSFIPVVGSLDGDQNSQYATLAGGARFVPAQYSEGGRSRAVGYQPVIESPNFGALLQIRPTLVSGEDTAIVDVRSTLTALGEPTVGQSRTELGHAPQDLLAPVVDRVAIETQELATTLSVPLGRPVLAGGLTYIGPSGVGSNQTFGPEHTDLREETPQLYLVLELR